MIDKKFQGDLGFKIFSKRIVVITKETRPPSLSESGIVKSPFSDPRLSPTYPSSTALKTVQYLVVPMHRDFSEDNIPSLSESGYATLFIWHLWWTEAL